MTIYIVLLVDIIALTLFGAAFARVEENENLSTENARIRNDKWHVNKAVALGLLFANTSYIMFNLSLEFFIFLIAQACLVILIFNPSINLNKGNPYFYLSSEGFEGYFKKYEVLYYLVFLVMFIGCLTWVLYYGI